MKFDTGEFYDFLKFNNAVSIRLYKISDRMITEYGALVQSQFAGKFNKEHSVAVQS